MMHDIDRLSTGMYQGNAKPDRNWAWTMIIQGVAYLDGRRVIGETGLNVKVGHNGRSGGVARKQSGRLRGREFRIPLGRRPNPAMSFLAGFVT
jgi:hypothetical protein